MFVTLFIFEIGLSLTFGVWVCVSDGVAVIHKYYFTAKELKINKSTLFLSFSAKEKQMVLWGRQLFVRCGFLFGIFVLDRRIAMTILVPIPNRGKQLSLPDKLTQQFGGRQGAGV